MWEECLDSVGAYIYITTYIRGLSQGTHTARQLSRGKL